MSISNIQYNNVSNERIFFPSQLIPVNSTNVDDFNKYFDKYIYQIEQERENTLYELDKIYNLNNDKLSDNESINIRTQLTPKQTGNSNMSNYINIILLITGLFLLFVAILIIMGTLLIK